MGNDRSSDRVTNKRTISRARRVVEDYVEVRVFVHARSNLLSATDAERRSAEWCVEVYGPDDSGSDKDQGDSAEVPA